ncbi:hypothetical protein CYMTET_52977 [Cymbomonas tetramitiformis]|uniref:EF-hand domain-containing protein n=1 Tax=Cymbomonas tetramitiformis TaxID=36881 RepID=A0AAE0BHW3_9CHLO|nr:hypothetical protein CYMTET_52977 [Cymbomonas tetramitiformis]
MQRRNVARKAPIEEEGSDEFNGPVFDFSGRDVVNPDLASHLDIFLNDPKPATPPTRRVTVDDPTNYGSAPTLQAARALMKSSDDSRFNFINRSFAPSPKPGRSLKPSPTGKGPLATEPQRRTSVAKDRNRRSTYDGSGVDRDCNRRSTYDGCVDLRRSSQDLTPLVAKKNHIPYHDKVTGSMLFANKNDIVNLKTFFKELDEDSSGSIDMQEIDNFLYRSQVADAVNSFSPAALVLAARFPGQVYSGALVKRIESTLRNKAELLFDDILKIGYPKADEKAIEKFVALVTEAPVDWELLNDPVRVARERKQKSVEQKKWLRWIDDMWCTWDADGSGELDSQEFKAVIRDIGASRDESEVFFREIDLDHSGTISIQEFKDWWIGKGDFSHNSIVENKFGLPTAEGIFGGRRLSTPRLPAIHKNDRTPPASRGSVR